MVAVFTVHVVAAFAMRGPIIHGDEAGYLGNARYLADGHGRTLSGYASGYSLLLVPAAWLAEDPLTAYHWSLVVNAVLAASLPLLAYALADRVLPASGRSGRLAAAVVTAVYAGFAVLSSLVLSENAFVPAVLACAWFLAASGESTRRWCVAAALAASTWWANPRGLAVVVAFVVACAFATRPWRRWSPGGPALAVLAVLVVAGRVVNRAVAGVAKVPGVGDDEAGQFLRPFFDPEQWNDLAASIAGRIGYLGVATLGLAVVGAAVSVRLVVTRGGNDTAPAGPRAAALFALLAVAGTVLVGAAGSIKPVLNQLDYLVYGRYSDAVVAPLLVLGAAVTFGRSARAGWRRFGPALVASAAGLVAVATMELVRPPAAEGARLNVANVLALHVYRRAFDTSLFRLLLVGVVATGVVLLTASLDRRAGFVIAVAILGWSAWVAYDGYVLRDSRARAEQRVVVGALDRLRQLGVDTSCISVDDTVRLSRWHLANYRFLVPSSEFVTDQAPGECGPLVLSATTDVEQRHDGSRPVSFENHVPIGLWLQTGALPATQLRRVKDAGLLGPVPIGAALPDAAYRSEIRVDLEKVDVTRLRLSGTVEHAGLGAPWPGSWSAVHSSGRGVVRLHVRVLDDAGEVVHEAVRALPRTLLPGEHVSVEVDLAFGGDSGAAALEPGEYEAELELVQEGVTRFGERGDGVTRVPFVVPAP